MRRWRAVQKLVALLAAVGQLACEKPVAPVPPKEAPLERITIKVFVRRVPQPGKEVWMFGNTATVLSGKPYLYHEGPLRLVLTPVSNGDGTITVTGAWTERANTDAPLVEEIPPITLVSGEAVTNLKGTLRLIITGTIHPAEPASAVVNTSPVSPK